uniref:ATP synthase subunit a n=1 Tax=Cyrtodactylus louisiadensis TaxID=942152 RepID=A0A7R7G1W8_9SAUR|nr:ATP synthase F0 subunit 6 [Cyrtodactylus louisiadensis]
MTMNLFEQFSSPKTLGVPLMTIALCMPIVLTYLRPRLSMNRTAAIQTWLMTQFTKHIMTPLNKPGHTWAPIMLVVMTYLLLMNLMGLMPYTFTPTAQLSMNMCLAVPLWLATVLTGLRNQLTTSLAHLLPTGTPTLLIPPLIIIETISLMIRPLALGVRLTANLTAGHLLMTLVSTTTLILTTTAPTLATMTATLLVLLTGLEIAVAVIQAYVFTLLLSLYLQENS